MTTTSEPAMDSEATAYDTVRQIIAAAGGPTKIAEASKGEISVDAIYKWPKIGINDRHWPVLMALTPVTSDELLAANIAARAPQSGD